MTEATFQKALALHVAGRLDEAEALYRQAATWRPSWTLGNLGAILRTTGRLEEAEAALRAAHADDPANPRVRHTLGMTLLQAGRYPEGWRFYEAVRELHPQVTAPLTLWQGQPLAGKSIVVVGEQGLGDQILLSRFVPLLSEHAARVSFAASRALVPFLAPRLPVEVFYPQTWDGVAADYWTPLAAVPRWLEIGPADAPGPPDRSVPGPAQGLGLMLDGAANNPNPGRLPPPGVVTAIRGLADFTDLDPAVSGARDFAGTAAIVACLEAVVTVDTSVAHLAGALGKPCFILMPRPASDWYTNWHDDRSPWYPSVRLIRQRTAGDWAGVIGDLAGALAG
jgi:hypothetical protein